VPALPFARFEWKQDSVLRMRASAVSVKRPLKKLLTEEIRPTAAKRVQANFVAVVIFIQYVMLTGAHSAQFEASSPGPGKVALITVEGELAPGDERKFIDVALPNSEAIVVFRSDGGDLVAGIEIGKAIRMKGYATLVPDEARCASACALAWLGGRVRFMSESALVGFHAAFLKSDRKVTSAGNALIGAYLDQLGLPASAVIYITALVTDISTGKVYSFRGVEKTICTFG
jgi:hypothetical protein